MFVLPLLSGFVGKFKVYIIMALMMAAMIASAVFYFNYSQNKIVALSQEIATVSAQNAILNANVSVLQKYAKDAKDKQDALDKKLNLIRTNSAKQIRDTLTRDIETPAIKDSKGFGTKLNSEFNDRLNRIQELTK